MFEKLNIGTQQTLDVLVTRVLMKTSRNDSQYQQLIVRDIDGVEVKINHFDNILAYNLPVVLTITVQVDEYQGNKTFSTKSVAQSQADIRDFMPKGTIDVQKTYKAICKLLQDMAKTRPSLSRIVCEVLKNENRFKIAAMNPDGAYARPSGVLEATYKLITMASIVTQIMGLDKDLMMAGACLYYIGYIDTVTEQYTATDEAVLLGATVITSAKVYNAVKRLEENGAKELVPEDSKLLLSILNPAGSGTTNFPEATALRCLSNLILNVEDQVDRLKVTPEGELVRDRKGRPLYKKRSATQ